MIIFYNFKVRDAIKTDQGRVCWNICRGSVWRWYDRICRRKMSLDGDHLTRPVRRTEWSLPFLGEIKSVSVTKYWSSGMCKLFECSMCQAIHFQNTGRRCFNSVVCPVQQYNLICQTYHENTRYSDNLTSLADKHVETGAVVSNYGMWEMTWPRYMLPISNFQHQRCQKESPAVLMIQYSLEKSARDRH